jgi:hypothetical protein
MLVQILYQVYAALARSGNGSGDKKGKGAIVGLAALICYYIGIYLLLYLSRTREYLADAFSASRVEPQHLASALIKIAYGIVSVEDTEATQSLLRSTRHLGVIDVKNAQYSGLIAESTAKTPGSAAEAMLFDAYNPWAALVQLNSTHPLTGRRIAHLGEIAREKGQSFGDYDVEAAAKRVQLNRGRLWRRFLFELLLLVAPLLTGLLVGVLGAWPFVPAGIAAGILLTLPLRYPFRAPAGTTVMALMSDPGASPVRGQSVRLDGKPIGRVQGRLHRRRRLHLPGQDRADGGRLPLHARAPRQSLRRLEAGAEAFRSAGRGHRLVQTRHGRLSRAARAQDGGRHAQGAATLLADPDLADRYRRE